MYTLKSNLFSGLTQSGLADVGEGEAEALRKTKQEVNKGRDEAGHEMDKGCQPPWVGGHPYSPFAMAPVSSGLSIWRGSSKNIKFKK